MDSTLKSAVSGRLWKMTASIFCLNALGFAPPPDEKTEPFAVIAYWYGDAAAVEKHPVEMLTHINYSFLHLKENTLSFDGRQDSANVRLLVSLKGRYPGLKIILSLGGWGGCETCSDVFSTQKGRREFAESAAKLLGSFHADGIDLDWEYPAIEGYPGHRFSPEDRHNFTMLVRELRKELGPDRLISFAAGGFLKYLQEAIEWDQVMPIVDNVNLMTYDLVNAASTTTGHHTPLYSTLDQPESTDRAVRYLDSIGVPRRKIIIGMAFYARTWAGVGAGNNGLYQPGKFEAYIPQREFAEYLGKNDGFQFHRDSVARAPYAYNPRKQLFATYDDTESIALKTRYALDHGLGGVMFWELSEDTKHNDLVDAIGSTLQGRPTSH